MCGILLAEFHELLNLKLENKRQMISRIYLDGFLKIRSIKENTYIYIYIYIYIHTHTHVCVCVCIFGHNSQNVSRCNENNFGIVAQIYITKKICLRLKQNI